MVGIQFPHSPLSPPYFRPCRLLMPIPCWPLSPHTRAAILLTAPKNGTQTWGFFNQEAPFWPQLSSLPISTSLKSTGAPKPGPDITFPFMSSSRLQISANVHWVLSIEQPLSVAFYPLSFFFLTDFFPWLLKSCTQLPLLFLSEIIELLLSHPLAVWELIAFSVSFRASLCW